MIDPENHFDVKKYFWKVPSSIAQDTEMFRQNVVLSLEFGFIYVLNQAPCFINATLESEDTVV